MKETYEHEVTLREEVEQRQKEQLEKFDNYIKMIRDRNLSVLKESKMKKKTIKEMEKTKSEMNKQLTALISE